MEKGRHLGGSVHLRGFVELTGYIGEPIGKDQSVIPDIDPVVEEHDRNQCQARTLGPCLPVGAYRSSRFARAPACDQSKNSPGLPEPLQGLSAEEKQYLIGERLGTEGEEAFEDRCRRDRRNDIRQKKDDSEDLLSLELLIQKNSEEQSQGELHRHASKGVPDRHTERLEHAIVTQIPQLRDRDHDCSSGKNQYQYTGYGQQKRHPVRYSSASGLYEPETDVESGYPENQYCEIGE